MFLCEKIFAGDGITQFFTFDTSKCVVEKLREKKSGMRKKRFRHMDRKNNKPNFEISVCYLEWQKYRNIIIIYRVKWSIDVYIKYIIRPHFIT